MGMGTMARGGSAMGGSVLGLQPQNSHGSITGGATGGGGQSESGGRGGEDGGPPAMGINLLERPGELQPFTLCLLSTLLHLPRRLIFPRAERPRLDPPR